MFYERTKHIDVKYHFVSEVIIHGDIVVSKVNIKDNPTNMLIKSICIAKFENCLNLVGVYH